MAIRPISSVSFNTNYNNVNFEGKKKEKSHHTSTFTNTIKSIPLAAIIAMSPMVGQAQAPKEKIISWIDTGDKQAINPRQINDTSELMFISTDGNDEDAEIVRLRGTSSASRKGVKYVFTTETDVKTLEVRNITDPDDGEVTKRYYAWGPGFVARSRGITPSGELVGESFIPPKRQMKTEISKALYDYLAELMRDSGMVEFTTTNKTERAGFHDSFYEL